MITEKQYDRLLTVARKNYDRVDNTKIKHFCFVVKGRKILEMGLNSLKTHPKSNTAYYTIHAETDVVIKFARRGESLEGKTVVVIRLDADQEPRLSKPCKHCEALLLENNVKRIFYSTQEGLEEL